MRVLYNAKQPCQAVSVLRKIAATLLWLEQWTERRRPTHSYAAILNELARILNRSAPPTPLTLASLPPLTRRDLRARW